MIRRMHDRLPHEVFELLEKTTSLDERIDTLKNNSTYVIELLLQLAFIPGIKFDLPEGAPPFKADESPPGLQPTPLKKQIDILRRLLISNPSLPRLKKESLFIRLLENSHAKDAAIIIAVKDQKLSELYPLLTVSLVKQALPNLLPAHA
jgi:hypothetical protein